MTIKSVYWIIPVGDAHDVRYSVEKTEGGKRHALHRPTLAGKSCLMLCDDHDSAADVIFALSQGEDNVFRNRDWFWLNSHLLNAYKPVPRFQGATA